MFINISLEVTPPFHDVIIIPLKTVQLNMWYFSVPRKLKLTLNELKAKNRSNPVRWTKPLLLGSDDNTPMLKACASASIYYVHIFTLRKRESKAWLESSNVNSITRTLSRNHLSTCLSWKCFNWLFSQVHVQFH